MAEEKNHLKESNTVFYAKNGSRIGLIAIAYIIFAAISYHLIEGWNWLDSFYFVVVTMSTVGYGDIAPKTPNGKLFTIFFYCHWYRIVLCRYRKYKHEGARTKRGPEAFPRTEIVRSIL